MSELPGTPPVIGGGRVLRVGERPVRSAARLDGERRLAALVNAAYGLTAEDVELLWRTAPLRMPG